VPSEDLAQYKLALMNHPLLLAGMSGQVLDSAAAEMLRRESVAAASMNLNNADNDNDDDDIMEVNDDKDNDAGHSAANKEDKSGQNSLEFLPRKAEKSLNYPLEKYLDPNRPYKCDVCKESFTQVPML